MTVGRSVQIVADGEHRGRVGNIVAAFNEAGSVVVHICFGAVDDVAAFGPKDFIAADDETPAHAGAE